jgi:hypothetical protein
LHPDWTFRDRETLILSEHRTQTGKAFAYRWGAYARFDLPLRFINSADQTRINAWWSAQDEVAFTLNTSETLSTVLCRIANRSRPLDRRVPPYDDLFRGSLELESLDGTERTRRPFILDDEISGLLDQNYNALVG